MTDAFRSHLAHKTAADDRMPFLGLLRMVVVAQSDKDARAAAEAAYQRWLRSFRFPHELSATPTPPNLQLTFDAALEANCALSERQLPSDSSSLTRARRRAPTNIYYASLHSGTFRWRFRCTQQPQSNPRSCLALAETFDPILLPAFSAATLCAMIGRPADNADIRLPSRSLPAPDQ